MNNPVAQNFLSFQPTALYAQSGSVGGFGFSSVAGRRVRTYPGGRKAATAVHSTSLPPNLILVDGTNSLFSPSHPTGNLPGKVKSWLPWGRGTNSDGSGSNNRSPDRPDNFREGWSMIFPAGSDKTSVGSAEGDIKLDTFFPLWISSTSA